MGATRLPIVALLLNEPRRGQQRDTANIVLLFQLVQDRNAVRSIVIQQ